MARQFHQSQSFLPETTGTLNIGSNELEWLEGFFKNLTITDRATVPAPVNDADAATKLYVDQRVGLQTWEEADGSPSISAPTTIRIDQADGLVLTNPSAGVARLDLASVPNSVLANSSVTVTAGSGLSGGGAVALGASVTLTNDRPVPANVIVMIASGTCADLGTGWSEYTAARGRFIVGVPNGGTVAGTAGSAMTNLQNPSVTPTFTGSALAGHSHTFTGSALGTHTHTFTGDALATHQHALPMDIPSTTTGIFANAYPYGSTSVSWAYSDVALTNRTTNSTANLSQAVSGGTPAGTNSATSAGTPAGTIDSVSAGTPSGTVSAVASNSLAPYIQLMFCQRA